MAKTLLLDIETSPLLTYTWGLYEQDVIKKIKPFTILSVAYQWVGESVKVIACDVMSERGLLRRLWKLLDQAEIVVAHNGDSFDIKKINTRFIVYEMPPYSPIQTVDTKIVAKSVAGFDSNALNNLGIDMSEGEKIKHRGFDMWEGCMAGNKRDWEDMKRYNMKDVELLHRIYLRLRPWMKRHPRTSVESVCNHCGSKDSQRRGFMISAAGIKYQRIRCKCGAWRKGEKIK